MGCCFSRKNRRKRGFAKIVTDDISQKPNPKDQNTTEITLKDASHFTIRLTINPDDSTTTYTISRHRTTQKSSIEIIHGENEISMTNTHSQTNISDPLLSDGKPHITDESEQPPVPSPTNALDSTVQIETATLDTSNQTEPPVLSPLQPHPPLQIPSASNLRRQRLRFQTQTASSLASTETSSSALSTEPSSLLNTASSSALLTPSTSEYDTATPIGSLSPTQTTDKHSSHSLPSAFQPKHIDTQFRSLPTGDSTGHFSKRLLVTSTPPLPPMIHRHPITPLYTEGTPLRIPIYENGDKQSFASFPKRIKLPRRFQGHFRCKECLYGWTSNYTWEGWGQKCRRCKTNSPPCYPYRLDTLECVAKVTTEPHSIAHCLRCQHLKRTMDKQLTCISYCKTPPVAFDSMTT